MVIICNVPIVYISSIFMPKLYIYNILGPENLPNLKDFTQNLTVRDPINYVYNDISQLLQLKIQSCTYRKKE